MKTVYLDKNIYSYMYARRDGDMFDQILKVLKGSKDFLVVYSYAHIEDILQSKVEEKNIEELSFIESIAEKNYCYYDNDLKKFCFAYYSPREIYDCQEDILPAMDLLFNSIDIGSFLSTEMKDDLNRMREDWISANMHSKTDDPGLKLVDKFFPTNLHELSIEDIFKEAYRGIRAFSKDNSIYRSLRANAYDNFNKGQYRVGDSSFDLTKDLTESPFGKSLLEIAYSTLKQHKRDEKEVFRYDFHTTTYFMLDLFGFNRDPKVKTNNLLVDAGHSYYGAHFDYVVSNDVGFVTKSRVLYKLLGINSRVLFPAEFLKEIEQQEKFKVNGKDEFLEMISSDSQNIPVADKYEQSDKTIHQYSSISSYLYYFDTLVKVTNANKEDEYVLFKSYNKYLENRIPVKILEQLVEKCLTLFGEDIAAKGKLNIEKESSTMMNNASYILRIWKKDETIAVLEMSDNRLFLNIGKTTENI